MIVTPSIGGNFEKKCVGFFSVHFFIIQTMIDMMCHCTITKYKKFRGRNSVIIGQIKLIVLISYCHFFLHINEVYKERVFLAGPLFV